MVQVHLCTLATWRPLCQTPGLPFVSLPAQVSVTLVSRVAEGVNGRKCRQPNNAAICRNTTADRLPANCKFKHVVGRSYWTWNVQQQQVALDAVRFGRTCQEELPHIANIRLYRLCRPSAQTNCTVSMKHSTHPRRLRRLRRCRNVSNFACIRGQPANKAVLHMQAAVKANSHRVRLLACQKSVARARTAVQGGWGCPGTTGAYGGSLLSV